MGRRKSITTGDWHRGKWIGEGDRSSLFNTYYQALRLGDSQTINPCCVTCCGIGASVRAWSDISAGGSEYLSASNLAAT
jgi:hypothetical protein